MPPKVYLRPDGQNLMLAIRGFGGARLRITAKTADREKAIARGYYLEELIRRAEQTDQTAIAALVEEGVITRDRARYLEERLTFEPVLPTPPVQRPTILSAFGQHPSTEREARDNPRIHRQHIHGIKRFSEWSKSPLLEDVTLAKLRGYILHMEDAGYTRQTIKHEIAGIKRACAIAPTLGIMDRIGRIPLFPRGSSDDSDTKCLDVPQATKLLRLLAEKKIPNPAASLIALQLGMSLRPSEVARLTVSDVGRDRIWVGTVTRKNRTSRRLLAIPMMLRPSIAEQRASVPADGYLFPKMFGGVHAATISHFMGEALRPKYLPKGFSAKHLRKTFLTHGFWESALENGMIEYYMGRVPSDLSQSSRSNYLASKPTWDRIAGFARSLNAYFKKQCEGPRKRPAKGKKRPAKRPTKRVGLSR